MDLNQIVAALNEDLSGTRGCAMSIVRFDKSEGAVECVSLGDVQCHLYNIRDAHFFTPTPVTLGTGHFAKMRFRVEKARVEPGSILVMFTDGLKSRTTLKGQLEVLRQPPIAIAQHLIENYSRPDDDAFVLVARFQR